MCSLVREVAVTETVQDLGGALVKKLKINKKNL